MHERYVLAKILHPLVYSSFAITILEEKKISYSKILESEVQKA